eukprot:TRINITY_DN7017_c0_g1_i1.p2 TRINITY_DN7017_c0_g1~~TRINITY_DN7017_c0_g1_i1.p2  ORF type:complete len:677 (-),score=128.28 TRINITY_DN7017_c0_g1_i1:856-2886(-)
MQNTAFRPFLVSGTLKKIDCVETHENYVFIGTSEAKIQVYKFIPTEDSKSNDPTCSFELEREITLKRGKKSVRQLACLEGGLLVTRCDKHIDIIDVSTFEVNPAQQLPIDMQVSQFCIADRYKICALSSSQRTVNIFNYTGKWTLSKEINLPEAATNIAMIGNTLAISNKKEYQLINLDNVDSPIEVFQFASTPVFTSLLKTEQGCEFLFAQQNLGYPISEKGTATRENYQFKSEPVSFILYDPFIISIQANHIEVHDLYSTKLVQTVGYKGINGSCAGLKYVFLHNSNMLFCLLPHPIEKQARNLIIGGNIQKGLDLYLKCKKDQDFKEKFRALQELAGEESLKTLQFKQAFNYFLRSGINPLHLLQLFPGLSSKQSAFSIEKIIDNETEKVSLRNVRPVSSKNVSQKMQLVNEAKENLVQYLESVKKDDRFKKDSNLMQELDTALLKLYADVKPSSLQQHIQVVQKNVPLDQMEEYLKALSRWNALALLYRTFNMNQKALDLWRKIGSGELTDPDSSPIEETVTLLSTSTDFELILNYSKWISKINETKFLFIFTNDMRKNNLLPHGSVLKFLQEINPKYETIYLEFIVNIVNVTEQRFHTALVERYITDIESVIRVGDKLDIDVLITTGKTLANEASVPEIMKKNTVKQLNVTIDLNTSQKVHNFITFTFLLV